MTNVGTGLLRGTATPDTLVTVTLTRGGLVVGSPLTTTADSLGLWSVTFADLTDSTFEVTATANGIAGTYAVTASAAGAASST